MGLILLHKSRPEEKANIVTVNHGKACMIKSIMVIVSTHIQVEKRNIGKQSHVSFIISLSSKGY